MIHADGYILQRTAQSSDPTDPSYSNILGPTIDANATDMSRLLQDGKPHKITSVPSASPSLVVAGFENSSVVLMSSTEFQDYKVVEVHI